MIISGPDNNAGLYVHIPFCERKCPYCDFYSITDLSLAEPFIGALEGEMRLLGDLPPAFDTIYIGGGTPSVLKPSHINRIIASIHRHFRIIPDSEITIEVNPGSAGRDNLTAYRRMGINRINIGVQSFQAENLKFLGRIHSAPEALNCVDQAFQAGFVNIGLDLIYGIPGQSESSWTLDLNRAVDFAPAHLSCYMLTWEPGTPMDRQRQQGRISPAGESIVSALFELTTAFLESAEYVQYEISNFARNASLRSRHNQKYWSLVPYIGLGPSAHSYLHPERRWNHKDVASYIRDVREDRLPVESNEILTREQQMIEAIYMGLRRVEGIDTDQFDSRFQIRFQDMFADQIDVMTANGLMWISPEGCGLTAKGKLFLDSIAAMLAGEIE